MRTKSKSISKRIRYRHNKRNHQSKESVRKMSTICKVPALIRVPYHTMKVHNLVTKKHKVRLNFLPFFILIYSQILEPMLFVDVNLGVNGNERIVVYEGDTAEDLAEKFAKKHKLDDIMMEKLTMMLQE